MDNVVVCRVRSRSGLKILVCDKDDKSISTALFIFFGLKNYSFKLRLKFLICDLVV